MGGNRDLDDVLWLDGVGQSELIRSGDVSASELLDAAMARCDDVNPTLNAVIHRNDELAHARLAKATDDAPFAGIAFLTKDLVCSEAGLPFHEGSRFLQSIDWTGPHDQDLSLRHRAAGLVSFGRTNTPEFGMRPVCEPLAYGPTRNPANPNHSAGGSSGGSAAAVAAGIVAIAHGNDVGGSIRNPASHCGLFGLKPSRSRSPMGPDFGDAMGGLAEEHVLTRSVRDSARVLDSTFANDPKNWYQAPTPATSWESATTQDPEPLRIGILTEHPIGIDPAIAATVTQMGELLESLGHHVEASGPAALGDTDLRPMVGPHYASGTAWIVDHHWPRVTGQSIPPELLEPETVALAEAGRSITAAALLEARELAQAWTRRLVSWWTDDDWDLLLLPVLPDLPPEIGQGRDGRLVSLVAPFNLAGLPAASVPGVRHGGLPVGVQMVAGPYREDVLFAVAAQVERAQPWLEHLAT